MSKTLPMNILDRILKHLVVKLQPWSFRERGVPLNGHYFQVHSDPEW